jgi:ectoine hydroxylase-related dioxygenase (phytanoyl-CoA dioxygenase family)
MTPDDWKLFESRGLICFRGFLPVEKVARVQKAVRECLEQEALSRGGDRRLEEMSPSSPMAGKKILVKLLKRRVEVQDLIRGEVEQAATELLHEQPIFTLQDSASILFTWPNAATWTVPATSWHVDMPRLGDTGIPGVQVFTFLDTVAPGGGCTVIVAGSHQLANGRGRLSSGQVKRVLKREPYFRELMSREVSDRQFFLHEPARVGGVEVQVVELYGEPGDVYFTDLRVLHAAAPNASTSPRIMMTNRYFLKSSRDAFVGSG